MNEPGKQCHHLVLWVLIALFCGSRAGACISTRAYPVSIENLRYLDSGITQEKLENFSKSPKLLNEAISKWTGFQFSETLVLVYDSNTSRLFVIGGRNSDHERIGQIVTWASHARTIYSICTTTTVLFFIICGLSFYKTRRSEQFFADSAEAGTRAQTA